MKKETMVAEFEDFQLPEENKQNENFSKNQKENSMNLTISALRELANQENTGLLSFMFTTILITRFFHILKKLETKVLLIS